MLLAIVRTLLLVVFLILAICRSAHAGDVVAFSLARAERELKAKTHDSTAVRQMAGMTRLIAAVVDERSGDVVVVGERESGKRGIALDDLVVALRARLVHHQWPLVSIDRTPETATTGKQVVRFEGGSVAGTPFGKALLEADIALKKLGLDLASAEIWGVPSYFSLCARAASERGLEDRVASRFWFRPLDAIHIVVREGVAVVQSFRIGVHSEVLSINGAAAQENARDHLGDRFASALTERLADVGAYFPEVARLGHLFELVALARGLEMQARLPALDFWLRDYRVATADTPLTYPLLRRSETISQSGAQRTLEVDGGIELRAAAIRLRDGDVTALREIVLRSRPPGAPLSWKVPVDASRAQGAGLQFSVDPAQITGANQADASKDAGAYLTRSLSAAGPAAASASASAWAFPAVPAAPVATRMPEPAFKVSNALPTYAAARGVGGVMLTGAASIAGETTAAPDLSGGGFGLIVEGQSARLAPEAYRRFVTALWAVYFSDHAPGISIDPIAPGVKRHLVRYIGNVVNTDLGRVMRVGDYVMKKAAVGTEPLRIPGFKDIDELTADFGMGFVGASRRFWFIPEDIRFRRAGNVLLFDGGRMTLKTEYVARGLKGEVAAADKAFSEWFTTNYQRIAAATEYKVYGELWEYAKLVSLATYVKEQNVPLLWFLLANKDQVLTEDSPGTVEALARGSRHRPDISIEGGVDLGAKPRYVYDEAAITALAQAAAGGANAGTRRGPQAAGESPVLREPANFSAGAESYAVIPDRSLTSGESLSGTRFQTDLALRGKAGPGLELVRYFDSSQPGGEFGTGWRVLVPYRVLPDGESKINFRNARLPKRMWVENRLTGRRESLVFSTERYSIAGYVPDDIGRSEFVGLFILSDGSFRLADKLGGEFSFDPAGALDGMVLSDSYAIRFEYLSGMVRAPSGMALRLLPVTDAKVRFRGVELPQRLRLSGGLGGDEILRFSDKGPVIGYLPELGSVGKVKFGALMSDGSLRVEHVDGRRLVFGASGELKGALPSAEHRLVSSLKLDQQKVVFDYELDEQARPRVARAKVQAGEGEGSVRRVLAYHYDAEGRLARVASGPELATADSGITRPLDVEERLR